jgi:hypothetical protein
MCLVEINWIRLLLPLYLLVQTTQSKGCLMHMNLADFGSQALHAEASWLAKGVLVKGPRNQGSGVEAQVWAKKSFFYKSTVIISPDAYIPSEAMSGLATALASTGRIVFVMKYRKNLAIGPSQSGKIAALAEILRSKPEMLNQLDPALVEIFKAPMPMSIVGHGMGGTILGDYIGKPNSIFIRVALFGVNSFATEPNESFLKLGLFVGSKDGLIIGDQKSQDTLLKTESRLKIERTILEGLNHFCIVSDSKVGDTKYRNKDLATTLSTEACITKFAVALDSFLP